MTKTPLIGESPVTWEQYKQRVLSRHAYPTRSRKDQHGKDVDPWTMFYITLNMQCQSESVRQYIKTHDTEVRSLLQHYEGYYPPPLKKIPSYLQKLDRLAHNLPLYIEETETPPKRTKKQIRLLTSQKPHRRWKQKNRHKEYVAKPVVPKKPRKQKRSRIEQAA